MAIQLELYEKNAYYVIYLYHLIYELRQEKDLAILSVEVDQKIIVF